MFGVPACEDPSSLCTCKMHPLAPSDVDSGTCQPVPGAPGCPPQVGRMRGEALQGTPIPTLASRGFGHQASMGPALRTHGQRTGPGRSPEGFLKRWHPQCGGHGGATWAAPGCACFLGLWVGHLGAGGACACLILTRSPGAGATGACQHTRCGGLASRVRGLCLGGPWGSPPSCPYWACQP